MFDRITDVHNKVGAIHIDGLYAYEYTRNTNLTGFVMPNALARDLTTAVILTELYSKQTRADMLLAGGRSAAKQLCGNMTIVTRSGSTLSTPTAPTQLIVDVFRRSIS